MLQFRLLGPVEAVVGDRSVPLGGLKPQVLLAALVLERGRVVSAHRLVELVWGDDPPSSARALIQTYVSKLRRALADHGAPDVIQSRSQGYLVRLDDATVDADELALLLAKARQESKAHGYAPAARLLAEAVGLSRGPALSGLRDTLLRGEARRLDELLVSVQEELFAAELSLGRLDHLAELTGAVTRHPANERLRGQLMVTLYRLGRQSDALACYREGREALVDELGVEPGSELGAIHAAILRGTLDLVPSDVAPVGQPASATSPAQLPATPADFTGRVRELAELAEGLSGETPAVRIVAGPGGCGKSALTVRAAHEASASFPDGQLYAELRGTSDVPATPGEILGRFLSALGMEAGQLPESTQERQELYRTLLSGRRILVVLDDAGSEEQVRPLLPGAAGCAVLISSRDRLAGLAGVLFTELDLVTPEEAYDLLARIVGDARLAVDESAAHRIVDACGRLPLALRIAGARLASRRQLPVQVLADRLTDERRRLNELSAGDLAVRSSIALSYRALDERARTALGRMGHLGLPDFSTWVVSWLLETSEADAEKVLEVLVDAQLATLSGADAAGVLRYRLHDLVRLYARERAEADEPAELTASTARALDGWIALLGRTAVNSPPAEATWRPAAGHHDPDGLDGMVARLPDDLSSWLQGEEPALAVAVERAAAIGLHRHVCDFVSAHTAVEQVTNRYELRDRIIGVAMTSAQHLGDPGVEADVLTELARLRFAQDRFSEARRLFGEALSRCRNLHDVRGQAAALAGMGIACREPGHLTEAVHFLSQAATLSQALDDQVGIGHVLRIRGSVRLELGDYDAARTDLDESLAAYQLAGSRRGVALSLRTKGLYHRARGAYEECMAACADAAAIFAELGDDLMHSYAVRAHAKAQMRSGKSAEALPRLEEALATSRANDDRWGQAITLRVLGQLHLAEARLDLARDYLDAAMSIWEAMETPLWQARTEYDLGLLHRERGDAEAAATAFARARDVFRARGAREYKEHFETGDNLLMT
ncbi:BTAD domain-containing putative transcriptional regulator [Lentzea sp. NPDC059081]|uniref:AfsR/SARP family transcriptional regulator n=1 Tax=Lentzea sp. NPDC059081 TaxID=3346719 RepID=UPI0036AB6BF6